MHAFATELYNKVSKHIDLARNKIKNTIDHEMVNAYWHIGRDIVEDEQSGETRAKYGKGVLKSLSKQLQARYQRGFSVDTLENARKFYTLFQKVTEVEKSETVSRKLVEPTFLPNLSWSHYVELTTLKREEERKFYAIEASKNSWSVRELVRQKNSLLFDRLLKKQGPEKALELANCGYEISEPEDIIKDPYILEFLGVPDPHALNETELESALITNLKSFLLELGKGFAFVARQKRLSFNNDHFYADLVFYHTILKCYVIIDLKTRKLCHGDMGQIQMYVNYFDEELKEDSDNPTIGLVLCTEKK